MPETHHTKRNKIYGKKQKQEEKSNATKAKTKYQKAELRPEVNKVAVGEYGVGLAELLIDEAHDEGKVMFTPIAHVLYLRCLEV